MKEKKNEDRIMNNKVIAAAKYLRKRKTFKRRLIYNIVKPNLCLLFTVSLLFLTSSVGWAGDNNVSSGAMAFDIVIYILTLVLFVGGDWLLHKVLLESSPEYPEQMLALLNYTYRIISVFMLWLVADRYVTQKSFRFCILHTQIDTCTLYAQVRTHTAVLVHRVQLDD
eukprot:GHVR01121623.1.p2 GENE.GHVR01121623.1~~GHVR01121623.1.p2  ORF type:complete len:168 (-),score=15.26 GHVR01121623.1:1214-1717(-)